MKRIKSQRNKRNSLWISLHEFSYAEFSSAIEMMQAAKRCEDIKIANSYIRHALDEYRHTHLMQSVISEYTKDNPDSFRGFRFLPNNAIKKRYVNPSKFLYQKYDFQRFSIFVGINEQSASKVLKKYLDLCAKKLKQYGNGTENGRSYISNIALVSKTISKIIKDEHAHEKYALGYANRNVKKWRFVYFLLWEKIHTWGRHLYASNNRINTWVASFVYFLVIIMIVPFRFVFSVGSPEMENLVSKDNSDLML